MKKIAFLFPGQGAQYPGMGLDLLDVSPRARKVFETASDVLGLDMISLIRDSDAETLKRTDISQVVITAASLAAAAFLQEKGYTSTACAGFSLGEYPALAHAGVISIEDCFFLTNERGKAMQAAINRIQQENGEGSANVTFGADATVPGMAAVIGLSPEQVETFIAEWKSKGNCDLYAANFNSPKQTVISGSAAALAEAETRFKDAGAKRIIRLQVAGPFHSPFMNEAAKVFEPVLEKIIFNDPQIILFSNVTGKQILSGKDAKKLAVLQITSPVRWLEEEASIAASGIDACFEAGPGKVLQGLWKDSLVISGSGNDIPVYAAGTAEDIDKIFI